MSSDEVKQEHANTLITNNLNVFNVTLGHLAKDCEVISLKSNEELDNIVSKVKVPTPILVIVGCLPSQENISDLLKFGFMKIKLMLNDIKLRRIYVKGYDKDKKPSDEEILEDLFDDRLVVFTHHNFYEHFPLIKGSIYYLVCEKVLLATFSDYKLKSEKSEITPESSRGLLAGLSVKYNNYEIGLKVLLGLNSTLVYDKEELLTEVGEAWLKSDATTRNRLADARVQHQHRNIIINEGTDTEINGLMIPIPDLEEEIVKLTTPLIDTENKEKKVLNFIVLYRLALMKDSKNEKEELRQGFYVNVLSKKTNLDFSSVITASELQSSTEGNKQFWVPYHDFVKVFKTI